jgi:hypothetical protein
LPGLGLFLNLKQPEKIVTVKPPARIEYAQPEMAVLVWVLFIGVMILGTIVHIWAYHKFRNLLGEINHLENPIIRVIYYKEEKALPHDMVKLIKEIADYNFDYLKPHCIKSYSWSDEKAKEEGIKILKNIVKEIEMEKKKNKNKEKSIKQSLVR